ncbi:hypothetical protein AQI88_42360 [Streptomyces cellostaticus]|uniref:Uncharacterized protein n=1 Tax=Streptomyces cellostaticus TaxID=67285 RepID=A0A124H8B5_9ACTN|nr:hypothetical protein [Streptomyces cellostaticus]KUM82323.1 hypothetical protein AQI88_42360 [Streptomyces cellostaticus]
MTTQHIATLPGPSDTAERDPRAWVTAVITTVLVAVLGPTAFTFACLSVMATDSCGPDDCSHALTTSLTWIFGMLFYGGPVAVAALLTTWLLPWKHRWSTARRWTAVIALVPPLTILLLVFTLPTP